MPLSIIRKSIDWLLRLIALAVLALGALLAVPLVRPPLLASVQDTARAVDRSDLPELSRFQARDGTDLAFRFYRARAPRVERVAVLTHGSSASSASMHALANALAARGVTTYALDVRGHGHSGTRGDVAYVGQLEDDLTDFVANLRQSGEAAPLVLIGHSSGGGFALRVAGSSIQTLFQRTVLLAPYLGFDAPTSRPDSGGWAKADIPRVLGLLFLARLGFDGFGYLPTVAFAVAPQSQSVLTATYSFRLMQNYATDRDFRTDLSAATRPLSLFAGADDELMFADRYADVLHATDTQIDVHVIAGVNHMAIVSAPAAIAAISRDVATR